MCIRSPLFLCDFVIKQFSSVFCCFITVTEPKQQWQWWILKCTYLLPLVDLLVTARTQHHRTILALLLSHLFITFTGSSWPPLRLMIKAVWIVAFLTGPRLQPVCQWNRITTITILSVIHLLQMEAHLQIATISVRKLLFPVQVQQMMTTPLLLVIVVPLSMLIQKIIKCFKSLIILKSFPDAFPISL